MWLILDRQEKEENGRIKHIKHMAMQVEAAATPGPP